MSELTPAASLAWKIGAAEASASHHRFIEPGHFLIGLLSLSKVVHDAPPGLELPQKVKQAVERENARVEALLLRLALRSTALRRALRKALGAGTHAPEGGPISRSASLRLAFRRARALAKAAPIDCVHLLAAVLEAPDPALARALTDTQAQAQDIYKQALDSAAAEASSAEAGRALQALLEQQLKTLREKHHVAVRVSPEASAFVAEQAARPAGDAKAPSQAVERWVSGPLETLATAGKLGRHSAWQLVYDEGGLYWLPDSDALEKL